MTRLTGIVRSSLRILNLCRAESSRVPHFSQGREDQEVKSATHLPCRISSKMRVIARSTIEIDAARRDYGGGRGIYTRGKRSREKKRE